MGVGDEAIVIPRLTSYAVPLTSLNWIHHP